jgi:acyl-CoA synthetase (AMP-forming)/AMP-acid ligase II
MQGIEIFEYSFFHVCSDPRLVQITPDDTLSGLLPFFHMYGLTMGLVALTFGTKLAVFPKFEAQLFLAAIQNYKVKKSKSNNAVPISY